MLERDAAASVVLSESAPLREIERGGLLQLGQVAFEARTARERFIFAEFLLMATSAALRRREREREHDDAHDECRPHVMPLADRRPARCRRVCAGCCC